MKHKWELTGFTCWCSVCKDMDTIHADWCDSDMIVKEQKRILNRNDCGGKDAAVSGTRRKRARK